LVNGVTEFDGTRPNRRIHVVAVTVGRQTARHTSTEAVVVLVKPIVDGSVAVVIEHVAGLGRRNTLANTHSKTRHIAARSCIALLRALNTHTTSSSIRRPGIAILRNLSCSGRCFVEPAIAVIVETIAKLDTTWANVRIRVSTVAAAIRIRSTRAACENTVVVGINNQAVIWRAVAVIVLPVADLERRQSLLLRPRKTGTARQPSPCSIALLRRGPAHASGRTRAIATRLRPSIRQTTKAGKRTGRPIETRPWSNVIVWNSVAIVNEINA
jgi:hypothetical protein